MTEETSTDEETFEPEFVQDEIIPLLMSDKTYNIMKWIVQYILPGLGVLYARCGRPSVCRGRAGDRHGGGLVPGCDPGHLHEPVQQVRRTNQVTSGARASCMGSIFSPREWDMALNETTRKELPCPTSSNSQLLESLNDISILGIRNWRRRDTYHRLLPIIGNPRICLPYQYHR